MRLLIWMLLVEDHVGETVEDWQALTVMLNVPPEIEAPDRRPDRPDGPLAEEVGKSFELSLIPESIPLILLIRALDS